MTTFWLVVATGLPRVQIGPYGCGLAIARRVDWCLTCPFWITTSGVASQKQPES